MTVIPRRRDPTVEWYTPAWIFDRLGLSFDLDPASPEDGPVPWVPASRHYRPSDNGLWLPWEGRIWLNPPYGKETGVWLDRLVEHGDGIALVFARTDTTWAQRALRRATAVAFVARRIGFVPATGTTVDEEGLGGPGGGAGSMLLAFGSECAAALIAADFGWTVRP
jgi:DNA N-6-adenine-methyltransferase (Dam)